MQVGLCVPICNIPVPLPLQGADKHIKSPDGVSAFDCESDTIRELLKAAGPK